MAEIRMVIKFDCQLLFQSSLSRILDQYNPDICNKIHIDSENNLIGSSFVFDDSDRKHYYESFKGMYFSLLNLGNSEQSYFIADLSLISYKENVDGILFLCFFGHKFRRFGLEEICRLSGLYPSAYHQKNEFAYRVVDSSYAIHDELVNNAAQLLFANPVEAGTLL